MSSFDEADASVMSEDDVSVMFEGSEAEDGVRCALSRRHWDWS
jgi:hypothetical protein